jgi:soluble lytic murein transglycosylase-like protein
MPRKKPSTRKPLKKKAPGGQSGGFLIDTIALPPIAVIIVSLIMACILLQIPLTSNALSSGSGRIAPLFTPEIQYWEPQIIAWSEEWNLDPNMVATVMQIESCGYPKARSGAGAMGLFQVMPYHFKEDENPYKPNTNAKRGLSYLHNSLKSGNDSVQLAFAGYNGGINGAKRPKSAWPAETIRYTYWGTGIYKDAKAGKESSARLKEWLGAGGASLCTKAGDYLGVR